MVGSKASLAGTAIWAATHTSQYGLAITSLNGIQDAVTCNLDGPIHAGSKLRGCIDMTVRGCHNQLSPPQRAILIPGRQIRSHRLDLHFGRADRVSRLGVRHEAGRTHQHFPPVSPVRVHRVHPGRALERRRADVGRPVRRSYLDVRPVC